MLQCGSGHRAITAAFAGVLASLALSAPALAGQASTLRDALFGGRTPLAPPVARYEAESAGRFVMDRSSPSLALMRFEDSQEIWALTPSSGPGGDVIYRNDVGEPVVRATRLGGMILFTDRQPGGVPVSLEGPASPALVRLPSLIGPQAVFQALAAASARASRAAQHLVAFDAQEVNPSNASVFVDAFALAAEAFQRVAGRKIGRRSLARYDKVEFASGREPQALVNGSAVVIVVAPELGVAGRPSSLRIVKVISQR